MHTPGFLLKYLKYGILYIVISLGCSKNVDPVTTPNIPITPQPPPPPTTLPRVGEIIMQAFYWDVPAGGTWYQNIESKLPSWKSGGITYIWLPPISKGQSGGFSMGYDPFDYFDFGQYNQHGTVETRFGSEGELVSLLNSATSQGFKLIADMVLNHNSGGDWEINPTTGNGYWTKFNPASGKFNRNWSDFHPNSIHALDEGSFGGFPDLCHNSTNVKDWFWLRPDGVGKFYKNTLGFDGWRFDYVKGFNPSVVRDFNTNVGGLSIGEFWDADLNLVNNWSLAANSGAFDFPLYYAMDQAFDGYNLAALEGKGLISIDPARAYTFVSNHDTEEISMGSRLKAYAYILTAEGTPVIFYRDYETNLDKAKLNALIDIKATLAIGTTTKLYSSQTEYIFQRNGTTGLVAYFTLATTDVSRQVQTKWNNTLLKDYTGVNPDVSTGPTGLATLSCKTNSYAVYAPKNP